MIQISNKQFKMPLSQEQKDKMQAAAKVARDKRKAEEEANPELKKERLEKAKLKKQEKKKKAENTAAPAEGKPKKERKEQTPEQKAAAIAKRKATIAAKKAIDEGLIDDDIPDNATAEEIEAAAELMRRNK